MSETQALLNEVSEWMSKKTPSRKPEKIIKLPGDASTRQYFRTFDAKGESTIVMKMEAFDDQRDRLPFLEVQKHLSSAGIRVPEVLAVDPASGYLLLEDLGDVTLLRELQAVTSQEVERHLYQKVIDELVTLHWAASPERKPAQIEGYRMRFDLEKLLWEADFATEHFYLKHLKREVPQKDLAVIHNSFEEICTQLAAEPTVMTHRDFHSRNIMVKRGEGVDAPAEFVMIDFQDARLGPAQYDLASLLRDSYYQLEESQIQRLIDYYLARWEALSGTRMDREHFAKMFDLMSVQRNYKAIGTFAFILNKRGNPTYLKFIGNTFENIRRTLLKYPQYSELREVLFHYYYF